MTGPAPGAERRRYPRSPQKFMIRFKCLGPGLLRDKAEQVGIVLEVSRGGFILRSPRTYLPGAILELNMPETVLGPPRKLYARVVWQRRTEETVQFDIGGAFVKISAPQASTEAAKAKASGDTRRFEAVTLGHRTGQTMRFVTAPAPPPHEERREHPRLTTPIYIKYRCQSKGMYHEPDERVGLMLDFSRGGFCFACTRQYPVESILEVKFPQTPLGAARTVHARVVRNQAHDKEGQFRVGCTFVAEKH